MRWDRLRNVPTGNNVWLTQRQKLTDVMVSALKKFVYVMTNQDLHLLDGL